MKLWQKSGETAASVERFTTGKDRSMDLFLARFDVIGSLAHLEMLRDTGLMPLEDQRVLQQALRDIYQEIVSDGFVLEPGVEDVHSQVELLLTRRCGEAGKKIHTGRSRNDQVLTDIKLFFRAEIETLTSAVAETVQLLLAQSERYAGAGIPGYTHFQVAMPSSIGLWLGAYAESLTDDLLSLHGSWQLVNKNPLGSAAGYGSSFPLNRDLTTRLLGFDVPHINSVAAQMARGKTERVLAQSMGNIAATLAKLAMDACLFLSQNFAFIRFPDTLTTGSSIMPHKKNPDVFELIRANCNALQALPNSIALVTGNLPSGYHRDFQLLKEQIFPAFGTLLDCLEMTQLMMANLEVMPRVIEDERYRYLYTVEEVNRLVQSGLPFRDAYRKVGEAVENGSFEAGNPLPHTHLGSTGNLGNDRIAASLDAIVQQFNFEQIHRAEAALLEG